MDIIQITPPLVEPVSVGELMTQMGMSPITDPTLSVSMAAQLTSLLSDAREEVENRTRRALITQTFAAKLDSFPGRDFRYLPNGYAAFSIPCPPVQSIDSFQYVDVSGALQTLLQDTTYGTSITEPEYGYQFIRGSETQPGQLIVSYPRIWPPTRMVPANVLIQFRCGYGGPRTVSIEAASALLSGTTFNPDDAPLLPLETGLRVCIPGAGPVVDGSATALVTNIASVDASGVATLKSAATTTVSSVSAWFGRPVPGSICRAIKFLAQHWYEQGSVTDVEEPRVIANLLKPYMNWVS